MAVQYCKQEPIYEQRLSSTEVFVVKDKAMILRENGNHICCTLDLRSYRDVKGGFSKLKVRSDSEVIRLAKIWLEGVRK